MADEFKLLRRRYENVYLDLLREKRILSSLGIPAEFFNSMTSVPFVILEHRGDGFKLQCYCGEKFPATATSVLTGLAKCPTCLRVVRETAVREPNSPIELDVMVTHENKNEKT